MKILLAVDGSPASQHAAQVAHDLFGADASYLAICVAEQPGTFVDPSVGFGTVFPYQLPSDPEVAGAVRRDALATATEVVDQVGLEHAEALADLGDPAEAILDAADSEGASVIVVASSDKGWFARLLSGSVADSLVRRSTIPVLVVR